MEPVNSDIRKAIAKKGNIFFEETRKSFSFLEDLEYGPPTVRCRKDTIFCLVPCIEYRRLPGPKVTIDLVPASVTYDKDDAVIISIKRISADRDAELFFVDKYIAERREDLGAEIGLVRKNEPFVSALRKVLRDYAKFLQSDLAGLIKGCEWKSGYDVEII